MKTDLGNPLRARVFCLKCQVVVYCDNIKAGFPPAIAKRRLKKIHEAYNCKGKPEYRCSIQLGIPK